MIEPRLRRALFAAAICSTNILGTAGSARPLYTHFLFFPKHSVDSQPLQIEGIERQSLKVPVENEYLSAWYFENPKSPYVVLVNHGNSGNISSLKWIARNLLSTGVSVMLYDYRGYGQSSKRRPDVESICKDGEAAFASLVRKGYKPSNIILYGQSLGCGVACHLGAKEEVAGMILQSGFSSLRTVAYQRFPFLQHAPALIPDALDNEIILSCTKLPLLVIHGDKNKVVPIKNAHDLFQAAGGWKELVVCPNSGHKLYPESDRQHRNAVNEFIIRLTNADDVVNQSAPTSEEERSQSSGIKQVIKGQLPTFKTADL